MPSHQVTKSPSHQVTKSPILSIKNVNFALKIINKLTSVSSNQLYKFEKNQINKTEWENLILSIDKPNLMQIWAYGEALNQIGWTTERYLVYYNNSLIAFFQVFKKKYFYSTLVKLQRGPLFLDESYLNIHLAPVLEKIRGYWRFWKGQHLQIECELPRLSSYDDLLFKLGFRRMKSLFWESTQVDLTLSEEQLFKNLKRDWRNSLRKSIKNKLELKKTIDRDDFDWLIDQYEIFKKNKKIVGVSGDLLNALYDQMIKNKKMHIMLAQYENMPVAGIIIATHGTGCSYLLGWNGELGRRLKAHNFLLWHAVKEAKNRGELFFDLGCVSSNKKYKSISDFKSGLNGKKYALIGEFY